MKKLFSKEREKTNETKTEKMNRAEKIGIFDSGIGGITVLRRNNQGFTK